MDKAVHLVITDSGLYGAYLDERLAHKVARAIEAVVVELPVTADYRKGKKRS